ncbi:MAG: sigma-70 family RNA polymerase sigma factor [Planctomycetes bacterium]|nr:sigma-70 family RNA polymerase sigma factor [Planctomycetota bacterium]
MPSVGSITQWLNKLGSDEELALEMLRRRLWPFLVNLARSQLGKTPRRVADEEDVAQEAFWGFVKSLRNGKLPNLENRRHLIALLVVITGRKVKHLIQRLRRLKRGGGREKGESALGVKAGSAVAAGWDAVASEQPSPEEEVLARDTVEHFMSHLPPELRPAAQLWLASYSHREIAAELNVPRSTVDSWIRRTIKVWQAVAEQCVGAEQ